MDAPASAPADAKLPDEPPAPEADEAGLGTSPPNRRDTSASTCW